MSVKFEQLLGGDFNGNAPATTRQIAGAEHSLNWSMPEDYREFLEFSSGGEGMIGDYYVMFWTAEELAQYNQAYQVNQYAPGLVLFGSDGGGEGFAFDARTAPSPVVILPFVGMSLDYTKKVAPNFTTFLEKLGRDDGTLY